MPQDDDDADHDKEVEEPPVSTATAPPRPDKTQGEPVPPESGHPQRPTKPAGNPASKPTASETEEDQAATTSSTSESATTKPSSSWISWLPTLGASHAARPWIYAAIGLISAFCIGVGISLYIVRRRRLLNDSTDTYAFDVLDEEEGEGLSSGEKTFGGRARRTRGGELYDAFAAGSSDEEDDDFDRYTDRDSSPDKLPGDRSGEQYEIGEDSDASGDEAEETRRLT